MEKNERRFKDITYSLSADELKSKLGISKNEDIKNIHLDSVDNTIEILTIDEDTKV